MAMRRRVIYMDDADWDSLVRQAAQVDVSTSALVRTMTRDAGVLPVPHKTKIVSLEGAILLAAIPGQSDDSNYAVEFRRRVQSLMGGYLRGDFDATITKALRERPLGGGLGDSRARSGDANFSAATSHENFRCACSDCGAAEGLAHLAALVEVLDPVGELLHVGQALLLPHRHRMRPLGLTRMPPGPTTSGMAEQSCASTGVPQAIASRRVRPKPSPQLVERNRSAAE